MRFAILLFALALSGCSFSVADVVPGHHAAGAQPMQVSFAVASVATPAPRRNPELLDVSTAIHSAITLPGEIVELEHVIVVGCSVLAAIGLVNGVFLLTLIARQRAGRDPAVQPVLETPVAEAAVMKAAEAAVMDVTVAATKTCSCGAIISARSKSGRCRQCALEQRRSKTTLAISN
jgi:hypothetical protein